MARTWRKGVRERAGVTFPLPRVCEFQYGSITEGVYPVRAFAYSGGAPVGRYFGAGFCLRASDAPSTDPSIRCARGRWGRSDSNVQLSVPESATPTGDVATIHEEGDEFRANDYDIFDDEWFLLGGEVGSYPAQIDEFMWFHDAERSVDGKVQAM